MVPTKLNKPIFLISFYHISGLGGFTYTQISIVCYIFVTMFIRFYFFLITQNHVKIKKVRCNYIAQQKVTLDATLDTFELAASLHSHRKIVVATEKLFGVILTTIHTHPYLKIWIVATIITKKTKLTYLTYLTKSRLKQMEKKNDIFNMIVSATLDVTLTASSLALA